MTKCRRSRSFQFWKIALAGVLLFPHHAWAQVAPLDFSSGGNLSAQAIQLFFLVTILSLAPAIGIMITCFPFILTVLSILRQAVGLQQSPPNMLLISLALFLTFFVMEPTFTEAWESGIAPFIEQRIDLSDAWSAAIVPFREFMAGKVDLETATKLASLRNISSPPENLEGLHLSILVPSFMLSEIARAFEIGFLVFLPFLIIDLVVAAILMSMGMMMVPPAIVSLPFKLAFFVVADGWTLVAEALVSSYR